MSEEKYYKCIDDWLKLNSHCPMCFKNLQLGAVLHTRGGSFLANNIEIKPRLISLNVYMHYIHSNILLDRYDFNVKHDKNFDLSYIRMFLYCPSELKISCYENNILILFDKLNNEYCTKVHSIVPEKIFVKIDQGRGYLQIKSIQNDSLYIIRGEDIHDYGAEIASIDKISNEFNHFMMQPFTKETIENKINKILMLL